MRFIINIALKTAMIVFLNWIGWLTLMSHGHVATGSKEIISEAIAAALIFMVVSVLTVLATFGLAALLWIFLGWLILEIMHQITPGFIALNHSFWLTAVSGFLILAVNLPEQNNSRKSVNDTVVRRTSY